MYISDELDEQQKKDFQVFLSKIINRTNIVKIDSRNVKTDYRGFSSLVVSDIFRVEERFKDEKTFLGSQRRPLSEGYEKNNVSTLKDGSICVKSILSIPKNDVTLEAKEIDFDPRLIMAYMNYPLVRKYAPNIPYECINEDIQEYQLHNVFGFSLATYNGLLNIRKGYEDQFKIGNKGKEQGN